MKNSMIQGPIFRTLLAFSLPMIVSNTVSILFHAASVMVAQKYGARQFSRVRRIIKTGIFYAAGASIVL